MRLLCALLATLLVLWTFNAYACVLPLPSSNHMACDSPTHEPVRQTCDAFLDMGPHAESGFTSTAATVALDIALPVLLRPIMPMCSQVDVSQRHDAPTHPSIPTTVLRI